MIKVLKLSALGAVMLTSGCMVVDPGRPGVAYSTGAYYGGGAYYVAPPVRVYTPTYYYAPAPRIVVVPERPNRPRSYRRWNGQDQYGR